MPRHFPAAKKHNTTDQSLNHFRITLVLYNLYLFHNTPGNTLRAFSHPHLLFIVTLGSDLYNS